MKKSQKLLIICMSVTVFWGFDSLSNNNTIFHDTLLPCCQAGYCNDAPCDMLVSVEVKPNCSNTITVDCATCIDLLQYNEACGDYDPPGNCYY